MRDTKTMFYNYRDVLEIYPEDTVALEMVELLGQVIHYYKTGDEWHRRHMLAVARDEYNEHLSFLKELRELAENMAVEDETALIVQDEHVKLNVDHLIKFVETQTLNAIMLKLRAIKDFMAMYLNENNIVAYRDSRRIIDRWEFAIVLMMMKGGELCQ